MDSVRKQRTPHITGTVDDEGGQGLGNPAGLKRAVFLDRTLHLAGPPGLPGGRAAFGVCSLPAIRGEGEDVAAEANGG